MFSQITDSFSRFASQYLSISHVQRSLQDWIRNEIVDDDPYGQQEMLFAQRNITNKQNIKRDRLINFQTKVFTLVSISESIKAVVIKELKIFQAYKNVISSNKRVYH